MSPTRQQLEGTWRKHVNEAKLELAQARQHLRDAERDLKDRSVPRPDGSYAYQRALRAETLALERYAKVLKTCNDLVLYGKIPESKDA